MSQFDLNNKSAKDPSPFIYLNGGNLEDISKALRPILNEWVTDFIKPFAEKADVSSEVIEDLEDLHDRKELLKITPLESQVLPWKWNKHTGTYEQGNLQISPWSKFSDAIAFVSQISPVKLANTKDKRQTRFMEFVKEIISNSVDEGNQPLVMIDSSNCVQLWPWLADSRMNANQINLGQQYERMQDEWKGARIIRIRQDLAPGIIEKKMRYFAETSLEDTLTKKELTSSYEIPSASSAMELFRLSTTNQTSCVTYLSVGRKTLHKESRGQSCYRETKINTTFQIEKEDGSFEKVLNSAGLKVHKIGTRPPFTGQLPTPNPLEIVVTLRQSEDNCDRLAALVESLRYSFGHYSDWSSLPAPLFFERVVRDYISEFAIEDEEIEVEQDLEE